MACLDLKKALRKLDAPESGSTSPDRKARHFAARAAGRSRRGVSALRGRHGRPWGDEGRRVSTQMRHHDQELVRPLREVTMLRFRDSTGADS